jgi:hypothetical protein
MTGKLANTKPFSDAAVAKSTVMWQHQIKLIVRGYLIFSSGRFRLRFWLLVRGFPLVSSRPVNHPPAPPPPNKKVGGGGAL